MAELNRVFRRGGVYWIRSRDEWDGSSSPLGRPAMVVSSDFGNDHSDSLLVAFCTTGGRLMSCNVPINCTEKASLVMCNRIAVIEKDRVGNKLGHASEEEMKKVDEALGMVLGLKLHKSDVDAKFDELQSQIAGLEEELMAKRVEIAMVEKMYEKALDKLAETRITQDLQPSSEPVIPTSVAEPSRDEGIATVCADSDKVNVNTASGKEISEKTGLSLTVAYSIAGTRKRRGCCYKSLEELLDLPKFTQHHLDKYGPMMEV